MAAKKWSEMTASEHIDAAQREADGAPAGANGLNQHLIRAQLHMQAAVALSKVVS